MTEVPPGQVILDLRETNRRLSAWLEKFSANPPRPGEASSAVSSEQMTEILSELMRAGSWLRSLPKTTNTALEQELRQYRRRVEDLRDLLPHIHRALIDERARLEKERNRLASASTWAQLSRQTL